MEEILKCCTPYLIHGLESVCIELFYVISSVCNCVFCSNTAGQWNQVFAQPPPEEEVHIGMDQDPRVRQVSHQQPLITLLLLQLQYNNSIKMNK